MLIKSTPAGSTNTFDGAGGSDSYQLANAGMTSGIAGLVTVNGATGGTDSVLVDGDSDFNGNVNFDDYVRTDNGFNNQLPGWANGDFDGGGSVNFDDHVLIDLAFNNQAEPL
jgi:hypothetical protein